MRDREEGTETQGEGRRVRGRGRGGDPGSSLWVGEGWGSIPGTHEPLKDSGKEPRMV